MKAKLILILVIAGLIFALGTQAGLGEEEEKKEVSLDAAGIMRQLDEVLANQAQMLKEIEEMKQELEIIKIRASR